MKITVKDILALLKPTDEISLAWGDSAVKFSADNPLYVDAYGDYIVSGICASARNAFEIELKMIPVRASSLDGE